MATNTKSLGISNIQAAPDPRIFSKR